MKMYAVKANALQLLAGLMISVAVGCIALALILTPEDGHKHPNPYQRVNIINCHRPAIKHPTPTRTDIICYPGTADALDGTVNIIQP